MARPHPYRGSGGKGKSGVERASGLAAAVWSGFLQEMQS